MSATKPLTPRDLALLEELRYFNDSEKRGATPLGLGGSNRSHHSSSLAKMARRGLVLKKNWAIGADGRRHGERGSCLYWITDEGRALLRDSGRHAQRENSRSEVEAEGCQSGAGTAIAQPSQHRER